MKRSKKVLTLASLKWSHVLSAVVFALALVIWQAIVDIYRVPAFLLPSPSDIWKVLVDPTVQWPSAILATLAEIVEGFALSVVVGLLAAILMVQSKFIRDIIYPYVLIAQIIPKVAIAPLLVIWLGFGIEAKMTLVFLVSFFPIIIDTMTGLVLVDHDLKELFQSLRSKRLQYLFKLQLPNSMPYFFNGLKVAISLATVGAVVAEFVSAKTGLGFLIIEAQMVTNTPLAFASVAVLSIIGMLLFLAVVATGRALKRWKPGLIA